MAIVFFSIVLTTQSHQPSPNLPLFSPQLEHAAKDASGLNDYKVLIQLAAENPHPVYDGDDFIDQLPLIHTHLIAHNNAHVFSDQAYATLQQKILTFLDQLESVGWLVSYEKTFFQRLLPPDNKKWQFQSYPRSATLFHIPLFHPQRSAYSPDTELGLHEWMLQF